MENNILKMEIIMKDFIRIINFMGKVYIKIMFRKIFMEKYGQL